MQWQFRTYVNQSGRNNVQRAIDHYDAYGRAAFSRSVAHLSTTPKSQWNEPHVKKLRNEDPLYEIRYKASNRAERALGYFHEDGKTFVIVLICYHKGNVYTPPDAFESAHRNIRQVQSGAATTVPLQIDGEDFPPDDEGADDT